MLARSLFSSRTIQIVSGDQEMEVGSMLYGRSDIVPYRCIVLSSARHDYNSVIPLVCQHGSELQLSQTISLCNTDIEFAEIARNLGFIFDSDLSLKPHILKTCKAAYIEIRRTSSIRQYLTEDASKTL